MMLELRLENWRGDFVGILRWDPLNGALEGDQADTVRAIADEAVRNGGLVSHPIPTWYAITDPLHDRAQMAVLLGSRWRVPMVLRDDCPVVSFPADLPDGAAY